MSVWTVVLCIAHIVSMLSIGWFMTLKGENDKTLATTWFPKAEDTWKRVVIVAVLVLGGLGTFSFFCIGFLGLKAVDIICKSLGWLLGRIKAYARATGIIRKE